MKVYYNEIDAYCVQWLRNLMSAGLIPAGDIDTRSIEDVRPDELRGYTQCHFFAGLGGWPLALALAGWPDGRRVWSGSCPCQPFSAAGKRAGFADERHLWPSWQHLISQCNPPVIFGEQVAAATEWLGLVCGDLENLGYAVGFNHIEAASAGADHRRDRLWFVADAGEQRLAQRVGQSNVLREVGGKSQGQDASDDSGIVGHTNGSHGQRGTGAVPGTEASVGSEDRADDGDIPHRFEHTGESGTAADADEFGSSEERQQRGRQLGGISGDSQHRIVVYSDSIASEQGSSRDGGRNQGSGEESRTGLGGTVSGSRWIIGHDGKARRVVSDLRGVVDGLPESLGGLCADYYAEEIKEVMAYAEATKQRPGKVLRALRHQVATQAVWQNAGGFFGISEAQILLPYLRELDRRLNEIGLSGTVAQNAENVMRSVRLSTRTACASQERRLLGQSVGEYPDTLHVLSQFLARTARQAFDVVSRNAPILQLLENDIPARVGKLRALGNAFVPQVAAEFVQAYLEARGLISDQPDLSAPGLQPQRPAMP